MAFNPPTSEFAFQSEAQAKFPQTLLFGGQVGYLARNGIREDPTGLTPPIPPPGQRPIAPLRKRLPTVQGKDMGVVESEARIKELQGRVDQLKFDLKEEQVTKQQQIYKLQECLSEKDLEMKDQRGVIDQLWEQTINQEQKIKQQMGEMDAQHEKAAESLEKINQQEMIIEGWRGKVEDCDRFRTQLENSATRFQNQEMELKEQAGKLKDLRRDLDKEKVQSKVFQTKYDEQKSKVEEIRAEKAQLQGQLDTIQQYYDTQQVQLQEAERKKSESTETIRINKIQIQNRDASLKGLEGEIAESKKTLKDLGSKLQEKINQVKATEGDLKLKIVEIQELTRQNKALMQDKEKLESEKEKTKQYIKGLKNDIDQLQTQRESRDQIEVILAEVQANAAELQENVAFLERENSELRATTEDLNRQLIYTEGAHDFLQTELDEVDNGNQSDAEQAPISTRDSNKSEDSKLSEKETEHKGKDSSTMTEQTCRDISTMTKLMSKDSSTMTEQMSKESSTMTEQTSKNSSTMTDQISKDTSTMTEQMIKDTSTMTKQMGRDCSIMTETPNIKVAPVISLKRHNPIVCWFQVYLDLWVLFTAWLTLYLFKPFSKRILGTSSHTFIENDQALSGIISTSSTVLEGATGTGTSNPQAVPDNGVSTNLIIGDVASMATTHASTLEDLVEPKAEPLLWQRTFFAFFLHLLFYYGVFVCLSIYQERSIWLTANELTRKCLHDFYKVPYQHNYGTFHKLLSDVEWLGIVRYNIHLWIKISRVLPG